MNVDLTDDELLLLASLIGERRASNARMLPTLVGTLYPDILRTEQHRLRELTAKLFGNNADVRRMIEEREMRG